MKVAAIFDLDGTILGVSSERAFFLYLLLKGEIGFINILSWAGHFIKTAYADSYTKATKANKMYLREKQYDRLNDLASQCLKDKLVKHIWADAIAEIERHRSAGRFLVLLSGTLDFLLSRFMSHLGMDFMAGTSVEVQGDVFTGRVIGLHPFGESKAVIAQKIARQCDINLSQSYGYANSLSDVPFLNAVGNAVAVNPDRRLAHYAKDHGWKIMNFSR